MAYPQASSRRRRRSSRYHVLPAWLSGRRLAALLAAVIVLPLGIYGVRVVAGLSKLTGSNPGAVIGCLVKVKCDSALAGSTQRINLALYGYGGSGHDGAYLTDSIMVVSIQPRPGRQPQVAEISIPRDWMVPITAGSKPYYGRINEAYSDGQSGGPVKAPRFQGDNQGGGKLAGQTLENLLGIKIDHFVGLDFQAFRAAVDAMGGIDVTVPNTFTDDQYPHGECDTGDCAVMTVHFTKGMQHMDGARALIFARSRHAYDNPVENGNFARNKRQQLVLNALKQKVLSVGGIGKLPDLLGALGDHVITDLSIGDANALYDMIKGVDSSAVQHVSIDDTNFLYECGYPRNCSAAYEYAHDKTYASVQHYMRDLFLDPSVASEHAAVTVYDATGAGAGSSTRWMQLLQNVGLTATDGGVVKRAATTRVIDASGGRNARTAQWLATYYGVSVEQPAPSNASTAAASSPAPVGGGVSLILGQDSERAWTGNGQSYPSDPGNNTNSASTWTSAAQQVGSPAAAQTAAPTRRATPPPTAPPTQPPKQTPTPVICLPPPCH